MPLQRLRIGTDTKSTTCASDDNGAHINILLGLQQGPAIFGVHAPCPGIHAVRPIQRNRRQAFIDGVLNRF
jgi:hypothetical protein